MGTSRCQDCDATIDLDHFLCEDCRKTSSNKEMLKNAHNPEALTGDDYE